MVDGTRQVWWIVHLLLAAAEGLHNRVGLRMMPQFDLVARPRLLEGTKCLQICWWDHYSRGDASDRRVMVRFFGSGSTWLGWHTDSCL
jgi:hypothetical protein